MAIEEQLLDELRKIRELLEPKEEPTIPETKPKGIKARTIKFKDDFMEFIKKYKVMGLAVAFIMALYLGELVKSLVNDIIMPVFAYIPGIDKISDWVVGNFYIGNFIAAFLTFIIVALIIFILVKISTKLGIE